MIQIREQSHNIKENQLNTEKNASKINVINSVNPTNNNC